MLAVVHRLERVVRHGAVQVAALLALHGLLFDRLMGHAQLPFEAYQRPVIALGIFEERGLVILLLSLALVLFVARRHIRWADIDPQRRARWFIWVTAGVLVWAFATMQVNFFFDHSYWVDRLVIVGLWLALLVHPAAVLPLLVMLLAFVMQLSYPLPEGFWHWPDKRLPIDVLVLFLSYLALHAVLRERIRPYLLPLALLCLVGTTYAHAAINKALLGPHVTSWPLHDDLANLFVAAHLNNGWLRGLSDHAIIEIAHLLHALHVPLALISFSIELSGVALVVRWRFSRVLLPAFVAMHLAILASTGIFFWKWMVVDLALLAYLGALRRDADRSDDARARIDIFHPRFTALSLAFVASSSLFIPHIPFAWWDTKLTNYFEIYGTGRDGHRYRIDARFFAPYGIIFEQSRHYYAFLGPVVVGTFGSTQDWDVAQAIEHAAPGDLPALYTRYGRVEAEHEPADALTALIGRYVQVRRRRGRSTLLHVVAPPSHFQRWTPDDVYDDQAPLDEIEIRFVEFFYDGDRIVRTRDEEVARFPTE